MEHFITGYPSNEQTMRRAVEDVLGPELAAYLWDRFLFHFFGEEDARLVASLGLNCVASWPINYRHFEDDASPSASDPRDFEFSTAPTRRVRRGGPLHDPRSCTRCPRTEPGLAQRQPDAPSAFFWEHPHFQDRVAYLWEQLARRYKDQPMVAGYDLMNEPGDVSKKLVGPVLRRLAAAVRRVDPDKGPLSSRENRYAHDFDELRRVRSRTCLLEHDYARARFPTEARTRAFTWGTYHDKKSIDRAFLAKSAYMLRHGVPVWVGERSAPCTPASGLRTGCASDVLADQLEIYARHGASWAIWLYKDIGIQGEWSRQARRRVGAARPSES